MSSMIVKAKPNANVTPLTTDWTDEKLLLAYRPVGFDRRLDADRMRVVYSIREDTFFITATGFNCWYNYFHGYQRRNAFFIVDVDADLSYKPTLRLEPLQDQ